MSRAKRLLDLIQILRGHKFPVTGALLAEQLGISLRTLYRDIATLQEQGVPIEGEAGLGYVLRSGFMLPPLMFLTEEIESLVLGLSWVAVRGDAQLSGASRKALTKIEAVLPADLRHILDESTLMIAPQCANSPVVSIEAAEHNVLPDIRQAIRRERRARVTYCDLKDKITHRIIWPVALGYFEHVRVLVAWCEARQDFRHFRADRIVAFQVLDECYPRRRQTLLKEWRAIEIDSMQVAAADKI